MDIFYAGSIGNFQWPIDETLLQAITIYVYLVSIRLPDFAGDVPYKYSKFFYPKPHLHTWIMRRTSTKTAVFVDKTSNFSCPVHKKGRFHGYGQDFELRCPRKWGFWRTACTLSMELLQVPGTRQQSSASTALAPSRPERLTCSRRIPYIPATVPLVWIAVPLWQHLKENLDGGPVNLMKCLKLYHRNK